MSGTTLRVVTWNVLHGLDLRRGPVADLDALTIAIREFDADVVALQEVDRCLPRSGDVDQIADLAGQLRMFGTFAPALLGSPDSAWRVTHGPSGSAESHPGAPAYGVGLLSRHPLEDIRHLALPGGGDGRRRGSPAAQRPGWDREPRVALTATVNVGQRRVRITTTHLSYLPWRGLRQLRVAAHVADPGPGAGLLLGDFNLPPWAVRAALRRWTAAGGEPTYPAPQPRMQVDQILVRGMDVVAVAVGDPAGSDHYPLLAELTLP